VRHWTGGERAGVDTPLDLDLLVRGKGKGDNSVSLVLPTHNSSHAS
jgi:hypothetical protein